MDLQIDGVSYFVEACASQKEEDFINNHRVLYAGLPEDVQTKKLKDAYQQISAKNADLQKKAEVNQAADAVRSAIPTADKPAK
jgi:hypothetical protein